MLLSIFILSTSLSAQCPMLCNADYNISLDENCEDEITADDVGNPSNCPDADSFEVKVYDASGDLIPDATVNVSHVGSVITYELNALDADGVVINSCWGNMLVEDKMPPTIECPDGPIEVTCGDSETYLPTVMDNCGNADLTWTDLVVTVNDCNSNLPENVIKRIERRYVATDSYGTVSDPCFITIDVIIPDEEVVGPDNYLYLEDSALQCDGNWPKLPNGNPDPVGALGTGVPTFDGTPLYPNGSADCGIIATYEDTNIPFSNPNSALCVKKIMRQWTVYSWTCLEEAPDTSFVQMLEIVDEDGPTMGPIEPMLASTSGHDCEAEVPLFVPTATDNCNEVDRITVSNLDGNMLVQDLQPGATFTFSEGIHRIIYRAYDSCGNFTADSTYVLVRDNTPPVPICDENTTVALTNDGMAWVKAEVFDDGSYDECALGTMVVKRMENNCGDCTNFSIPNHDYLGEYNGKYYFLSERAVAFNEAIKWAEALEGKLAMPRTTSALNWIKTQVYTDASVDSLVFLGIGRDDYQSNLEYVDGATVGYPYQQYPLSNSLTNIKDRIMRLVEFDANAYFSPYFSGILLGSKERIRGYNRFRVATTPAYLFEVPGYEQEIIRRNSDDPTTLGTYKAKYVLEITDPCGFASHVKYCCADEGADDLMVSLRVIDAAGNFNDCMVNVDVQNKIPYTLTCPDDMTVNCDFTYDLDDLASTFGTATVTGNCEDRVADELTPFVNINECGTGYILRRFRLGSQTCQQRINFEAIAPFNEQNIKWPGDVYVNSCGDPTSDAFFPENLPVGKQRPTFGDVACSLVGSNYRDEVYRINNPTEDACFKILRYWTVADWCQRNDDGTFRSWTHIQIIKVRDNSKPVITGDFSNPNLCTYDPNCANGYVELIANGEDSQCTDVLKWTYLIDVNNDGSFDSGLGGSGNGNTINASDYYPIGTHKIRFVFEDKCGNQEVQDQVFTINNCKTPTPYLIDGLVMPLMPVDTDSDGTPDAGMATVWATDFDKGSNHVCGYEVYLSFDPVVRDASGALVLNNRRDYDCTDLGVNDVVIYAAIDADNDQGEVIQSFATTTIFIQNNSEDICDGMVVPESGISGRITTSNEESVKNVEVALEGSEFAHQMTTTEGTYVFPDMPQGGAYVVNPQKDDDVTNGVTTIDIVMIQRHILNKSNIDNVYDLIAADVNNDGVINPLDLLELRKVILRVKPGFANNTSWRFIDKAYEFVNAEDPFSVELPEVYEIDMLGDDMAIDFTAIKVGDINNSVDLNFTGDNADIRNQEVTVLHADNVEYNAGQSISVPVVATEGMDLAAAQFTVSFDASSMNYAGIASDKLTVSDNNVGTAYAGRGLITFSYDNVEGADIQEGDVLFTLDFDAVTSGELVDNISINSDITEAELLSGDRVSTVSLKVGSTVNVAGEFVLNQNTPNPFSQTTEISFELPETTYGSLSIVDVTGKVVKVINRDFNKGLNTVMINRNDLNSAGIFYYTVKAGEYTATKKMVLID